MKDYTGLSVQFIEEMKKAKSADGSRIYEQEVITYKILFKHYLPFAEKHNLGLSDSSFRKGLFIVMEGLGFVTKKGEEIRFGKTVYDEYVAIWKKKGSP
jgi:hypothetical protein